MTHRENRLRAFRFQSPDWIPVSSGFPAPCWEFYGPDPLEDILSNHPIMFPGYQRGSIYPDNLPVPPHTIKGEPYTDPWGSVWETQFDGMVGAVRHHPLSDWSALESFSAPDPEHWDGMLPIDWREIEERGESSRKHDGFFALALTHGHTFLRLSDLRGYENLLYDMVDEEPRLLKLIEIVEDFNLALIEKFLSFEPDMILIPEDLGTQTSPLLSPDMFRKYIKPSYLRLTAPVKERGILVHEHSDGYILDLIDDLVDVGGDIINLQDLVNGIDNIEKHVKGRLAIDLDIDRQNITVHGSPADVDDHIREAVMKLGGVEGGFAMCYQPWPPTPIENIRAAFDAMENYCTYFVEA